MGKWELKEKSGDLPVGTIFDFQKEAKLVVTAVVNGEKKMVEFGYELKGNVLRFDLPGVPGGKSDTTEVATLDKTDLVCKDKNGTIAKFKRLKAEK